MPGALEKGTAAAKSSVKRVLGRAGIKIVRTNAHGGIDEFIPFEETMQAAQSAGLSVGDYIDGVMNRTPGATQHTIDELSRLGVFADKPTSVLEIGPGSGRYLEKVLQHCSPDRYEVYETAAQWLAYLTETYDVVAQPTAGCSLGPTTNDSVDLVMAHKVFNGVTFLCSARYFFEMVRVTRPGGRIVFDVLTETCLEPATVRAWASGGGGEGHGSYPTPIPRKTCVDLFASLDCSLKASFLGPLSPIGSTEVLVFRKNAR